MTESQKAQVLFLVLDRDKEWGQKTGNSEPYENQSFEDKFTQTIFVTTEINMHKKGIVKLILMKVFDKSFKFRIEAVMNKCPPLVPIQGQTWAQITHE